MNLELKDKVVLVAAASRGLGKAAALEFSREGAQVAMCARGEAVHETAREISSATGMDTLGIQADLTHPEEIRRLVRTTLERFGRLDVLIVNGGGPPPGGFLDLTVNDWRKAAELTLFSAIELCYAVVPHMVGQGDGSIVAVQSYTVRQPADNLVLSNSLRMAVQGLMKSLAIELGPRGIRVNSINPYWTWTERVEELIDDRARRSNGTRESEAAKLAAAAPLGRFGEVEEFGRTIAWLASPAASYIHGQSLLFDGGAVRSGV